MKTAGAPEPVRLADDPDALQALFADCAFFLDIDGTLLEIAEHPYAIRADPELRLLLRGLHDATGGAMALISGRSVAYIDRLLASANFCVAGQHGAERRDATGTLHRHFLSLRKLRRAGRRLRQMVSAHPDLVLEDKGMSLALHYRLAPELGGQVQDVMRGLAEDLGEGFEVQEGKMVFEIKPSGRNKGTAIAAFMDEKPFHGRLPVFIGDDLTDEIGFDLVNRIGGHAVKVGEGPTAARLRLADASAVRGFLASIVRRWHSGGSASS